MDTALNSTIVGGLIGLLGALVPEVIALVHKWMDSRTGTVGTNGSVVAEGEVVNGTPVRATYERGRGPEAEAQMTLKDHAMDVLRESVRPVLTYAFFALYVTIKLVVLTHSLSVDHAKAADILPILWDEGTETMFATTMAFWFGSRMMVRFRRRG